MAIIMCMCMLRNPIITIIDSGIDVNNPIFQNIKISGISVDFDETTNKWGVVKNGNVDDEIGHGTAISSIIIKKLAESNIQADLIIVKIFDKDYKTDEEKLLVALKYISENITCDIVHLSLGITICSKLHELFLLCEKLYHQGKIIVGAFDNMGALSYPASFKHVIGVDVSELCKGKEEWAYVENSPINILTSNRVHRCSWLNGKETLIEGSSFSAAYITAFVAEYMKMRGSYDYNTIMNALKVQSTIFVPQSHKTGNNKFAMPKKAIVFPFNKEMHSLRRFQNELSFEIVGYYDTVYSRNVHKSCDSIIGGCERQDNSIWVEDIKSLDWKSDFDTLILGHIQTLSEVLKTDMHDYFISKCQEFNKNLFSFDDVSKYSEIYGNINVYSPKTSSDDLLDNSYGKLFRIGKPIIGVFGTSSKQGKFTLQLELRKRFIKEGYRVGQLGTEPHSELFGFDEVFPMGYNYNIELSDQECIPAINNKMHQIELKNPDVIIVGGQSSTIPYYYGNTIYISQFQQQLLYATVPDCFVLVVNAYDDIGYIKKTINYLESIGQVLAIVVSPVLPKVALGKMTFKKNISIEESAETFGGQFKLPVYMLTSESDLDELYLNCKGYFEEKD